MPPSPSLERISYGPSRVPAAKVIYSSHYKSERSSSPSGRLQHSATSRIRSESARGNTTCTQKALWHTQAKHDKFARGFAARPCHHAEVGSSNDLAAVGIAPIPDDCVLA